eukprot:GHRR01009054.1.p1 GENE.GHRR01009054.1~~GHRR01009054.1.p1  ORF type:complete len:191 (-),score=40.13 GHRR01009054.1:1702-2274(-)
MSSVDVAKLLKPVLLKDLRIQCRARGLSPAGGKEQLTERLKEDMIATNDYTMRTETGEVILSADTLAGQSTGDVEGGNARNNYSRPEGQNVGNFLTDRPSSRVLAAPGGGSSIVFGSDEPAAPPARTNRAPPSSLNFGQPSGASGAPGSTGYASNNYARPDGQNVGNFMTDRKSVKVAAPPGGASQITFG